MSFGKLKLRYRRNIAFFEQIVVAFNRTSKSRRPWLGIEGSGRPEKCLLFGTTLNLAWPGLARPDQVWPGSARPRLDTFCQAWPDLASLATICKIVVKNYCFCFLRIEFGRLRTSRKTHVMSRRSTEHSLAWLDVAMRGQA